MCVATTDCRQLLASELKVAALCNIEEKVYGIKILPTNLINLAQHDII